ncbi:cell division protein FtsQ [Tranquillimonas rosea]|uniref:Cell division protein FtsQ n=1 Tax=Tranquillimonas rosea TaxID=641238 RepID=A0A1H9UZZ6_9RHOB|nr:cell division protein FtsQ/DivIB [Tranquillimonas rosea]SES14996.1 cell division protein FtsQ [Tranquillimonas rosea]
MSPVGPRDPAPSRLAYRLQRLMLTPGFRRFLRTGLPCLAVIGTVGILAADQERREAVRLWVDDLKAEIQQRPEFMVKLMAVDGASPVLAETIREVIPVDLPMSSFDLDLPDMQAKVQQLDAVKSAELRVRPGGVLQVSVDERQPVIVWRNAEGLELLDETGHPVMPVRHRQARQDLPLIVGRGADQRVAEARALLDVAAPIDHRIRGLLRVGERRWDVVLDRDQRIALPETEPVQALERVIAMDMAQDLLSRAVTHVDMRNVQRPTVRMADTTATELRRISANQAGATTE